MSQLIQSLSKNIFVSYRSDDEFYLNYIESTCRDRHNFFKIKKYEVKKSSDKEWKTIVQNIIKHSFVVLVIIGKNTSKSKSIDWEIQEAIHQNKKIIGVKVPTSGTSNIPQIILDHNYFVVDLNIDYIVKILKEYAKFE